MKVKELIAALQKQDQELDVWVSADDGDDLPYDSQCESVDIAYVDEHYPGVFVLEEGEEADGPIVLLLH